MPPFLGQGANQSLQDAWCLAERLSKVGGAYGDVKEALDASLARPKTADGTSQPSRLIAPRRDGGGPVALARDAAFLALGAAGVAGKIFLKNAMPVLD